MGILLVRARGQQTSSKMNGHNLVQGERGLCQIRGPTYFQSLAVQVVFIDTGRQVVLIKILGDDRAVNADTTCNFGAGQSFRMTPKQPFDLVDTDSFTFGPFHRITS